MSELVECWFRKWDEQPHWRFKTERLGTDEHGVWLGARSPTPYDGPHGTGEFTHGFAILVPEGKWWIASFNDQTQPSIDVYVDICTPPEWRSPTEVTSIDLDLDVIRDWDGTTFIDDEDEFEEHRVKFDYPTDVVETALRTAQEILRAVTDHRAPFDGTGRDWLRSIA